MDQLCLQPFSAIFPVGSQSQDQNHHFHLGDRPGGYRTETWVQSIRPTYLHQSTPLPSPSVAIFCSEPDFPFPIKLIACSHPQRFCFPAANRNFATITIDWEAAPVIIELQIRDEEGYRVHKPVRLRLSDLQVSSETRLQTGPGLRIGGGVKWLIIGDLTEGF